MKTFPALCFPPIPSVIPSPPGAEGWLSLPSEDSEADEERLTLKAMSESLSYWEPPGDPEGDTVTGLDCTVPEDTGES